MNRLREGILKERKQHSLWLQQRKWPTTHRKNTLKSFSLVFVNLFGSIVHLAVLKVVFEFYTTILQEMACAEYVSKQAHLNSTALISFAELVKRGFTSKSSTLNHFPIHSFGLPHSRKSKLAEKKYIPHMETKLVEAIENGDSAKIQTYIWALGQTAHPKVLEIFLPFLNGICEFSTDLIFINHMYTSTQFQLI